MKLSGTYAIIPARAGSKGIPDKNVKLLSGKPLIAYSIAAAKLASNIDRVIVSTDSSDYAKLAEDLGAEVPFLRPPEISGDKNTDYELIRHVLDWFSENEKQLPEYLVHIRPTTPLREVRKIESAIELIKSRKDISCLRSVHQMSESSYKTFEVSNGLLKCVGSGSFELDFANSPRQSFPDTYQGNGYVDVLKTSYILDNERIHGNKALAYITPYVTEVDVIEDFKFLEFEIKSNPLVFKDLFGA